MNFLKICQKLDSRVKELSLHISTYYTRCNRGILADKNPDSIGDILVYQTRGEKIRKFIREKI